MTSQEVAARCGVANITVIKWAAANSVAYVGEGKRKTYTWTDADVKRFKDREKPGRRWPEKPITVNEDNVLIDGHARLEAAKKTGIKKIPVERK